MKKLFFAVALFIATMFVSCSNNSNGAATDTDSVVVDSIMAVDSIAVDSIATDSVTTDSVVCSYAE